MTTKTASKEEFAKRLMGLIEESKMDYRPLAKDIGISQGSLSKYSRSEAEPGLNALIKLSEYFGVSIDYLAGRVDVRSPRPDLQGAVDFTGLSERVVQYLHEQSYDFTDLLSKILCDTLFSLALQSLLKTLEADREGFLTPTPEIQRLKDGRIVLSGTEVGNHHSYFAKEQFSDLIKKLREEEVRSLYVEE